MPTELWTKLVAEAPALAVLLLVLWRGGEKLDKLGEKLDKVTSAVKHLSGRVELIGKLQDVRLDLHEERTVGTGKHPVVTDASLTVRPVNGLGGAGPVTRRPSHPSWPDQPTADEE